MAGCTAGQTTAPSSGSVSIGRGTTRPAPASTAATTTTTTRPGGSTEGWDRTFSCAVCSVGGDSAGELRLLPCLHVSHRDCFSMVASGGCGGGGGFTGPGCSSTGGGATTATTAKSSATPMQKSFSCPVCRAEICVNQDPNVTYNGLPRTTSLFGADASSTTAPMVACGVEDAHDLPEKAKWYCASCAIKHQCDGCREFLHRTAKGKTHTVVPVEQSPFKPESEPKFDCSNCGCPKEISSLSFCCVDSQIICVKCQHSRHMGHKVRSVEISAEMDKSELKVLNDSLKCWLLLLENSIASHKECIESVQDATNKQRTDLNNESMSLTKVVARTQLTTTEQIEANSVLYLSEVEEHKRLLDNLYREGTFSKMFCQKTLDNCSSCALLSAHDSIAKKIMATIQKVSSMDLRPPLPLAKTGLFYPLSPITPTLSLVHESPNQTTGEENQTSTSSSSTVRIRGIKQALKEHVQLISWNPSPKSLPSLPENTATPLSIAKDLLCAEHDFREATILCACNKLVCSECTLEGDHKEHGEYTSVKGAFPNLLAALQDQISTIKEMQQTLSGLWQAAQSHIQLCCSIAQGGFEALDSQLQEETAKLRKQFLKGSQEVIRRFSGSFSELSKSSEALEKLASQNSALISQATWLQQLGSSQQDNIVLTEQQMSFFVQQYVTLAPSLESAIEKGPSVDDIAEQLAAQDAILHQEQDYTVKLQSESEAELSENNLSLQSSLKELERQLQEKGDELQEKTEALHQAQEEIGKLRASLEDTKEKLRQPREKLGILQALLDDSQIKLRAAEKSSNLANRELTQLNCSPWFIKAQLKHGKWKDISQALKTSAEGLDIVGYEQDGRIVVTNTTKGWKSVIVGSGEVSPESAVTFSTYTVRVENVDEESNWMIGVIPKYRLKDALATDLGHCNGAGLYPSSTGHGQLFKGVRECIGPEFAKTSPGDTIEMNVHLHKGTISFTINSIHYGVLLEAIPAGFYVCLSVCNINDSFQIS
ncbi:hypothetical protein Pelo_16659 [Pelomyxa schiedti]|nr:hypothetical protein Pelo_16659 [Pelomyxa schiedti]